MPLELAYEEIERRRGLIILAQTLGISPAHCARMMGISKSALSAFMQKHAYDRIGKWTAPYSKPKRKSTQVRTLIGEPFGSFT